MTNHFITDIAIKDFKCFDDFKAEGLTQVNLIGGKNNVGKTAFMEACCINIYSIDIKSFTTVLMAIKLMRENQNFISVKLEKKHLKIFLENNNDIQLISNKNNCHFYVNDDDGVIYYIFSIQDKKTKININNFSYEVKENSKISFLDSHGGSSFSIKKMYAVIQKNDKEDYLNQLLKEVDPAIESFKVIEEKPQCKVNGKYLVLTELGDGIRHIISIVTSLYASENGQLFIDEIDNGIHFTLLARIWEIIFTLSQELNVQVFATTHSKECIEAFNRTQLKLKHQDSCYFEMARHAKTNAILMQAIDSKQLTYELTHHGKYRGE